MFVYNNNDVRNLLQHTTYTAPRGERANYLKTIFRLVDRSQLDSSQNFLSKLLTSEASRYSSAV